jgi:phospholipid/cholesterol/gamma-HCH transport system substrate-binding protein
MQKQAPSLGRILAMVVFAMSCFGLLLFLWLSFGGPIPLRPQGYRFEAAFPEAATLAQEADVRIAGVNVGRVKKKELQRAGRTLVTLELEARYAPIPEDTRAILRQKTLLGETYVELSTGTNTRGVKKLADGGRLENARIERTVELDDIFGSFDKPTRRAFQTWVRGTGQAIRGGRGQDLNDAIGNLARFATDGADVLGVLNEQEEAVHNLVKNTGVVFAALNERYGQLGDLIVNSNNVFEALASVNDALAETFLILPTFLRESRLTFRRLDRFAINTRPLVRDLKPVADDLGPTIRDVGALAPDLEQLFRDLDPLITVSNRFLPDAVRILDGARPVFRGLHVFLQELNPVIAFANFEQEVLAGFFSNGGSATNYRLPDLVGGTSHVLSQYGINNNRSLSLNTASPSYERANAYIAPNAYMRALGLGVIEPFESCAHADARENPIDGGGPPGSPPEQPPCFVAPKFLYGGTTYPKVERGEATLVAPPRGAESTEGLPRSFGADGLAR